MNCSHDDVELTQDVVRQIQIAVLQDVHLDPLEQGEPAQISVQPVDLVNLVQQPFRVEAARDGDATRVIGNCQILEAPFLCRLGHLAEAVPAVSRVGVAMQVTPEVGQLDEPGNRPEARPRSRHDPHGARRDIRKTDAGKHRLLGRARDAIAAAKDTVLIDLQAELLAHLADGNVMRLAPCEVIQRGPVTLLADHGVNAHESRQAARHKRPDIVNGALDEIPSPDARRIVQRTGQVLDEAICSVLGRAAFPANFGKVTMVNNKSLYRGGPLTLARDNDLIRIGGSSEWLLLMSPQPASAV